MFGKTPKRLIGYCWGCHRTRVQNIQTRILYVEELEPETPLTKGFKKLIPKDYWCHCKRCGHRNLIRRGEPL